MPDGGPAPQTLDQMPRGAFAVLGPPSPSTPEVVRLTELGMTPGARVEVIRKAPLGGPIQVRVRGTRLCLRQADARRFPVSAPVGEDS